MKTIGLIIVVLAGGLLLYATRDFPPWGDPTAPASLHVSPRYLEKAIEETAVPNVVTAVLADYRGFDTMFETMVIFCAGIACFGLLRVFKGPAENRYYRHIPTGVTLHVLDGRDIPESPDGFERIDTQWTPYDLIIKTVCRLLIPFVQLFALYVIAHGHHSPGGGFQGGVILGASIILLALSHNLQNRDRPHERNLGHPAQRGRGADLLGRGRAVPHAGVQFPGLRGAGGRSGRGPGHGPLPRHSGGRDGGGPGRDGGDDQDLQQPGIQGHIRGGALGSDRHPDADRCPLQLLALHRPDDDRALRHDRQEQPHQEARGHEHLPDRHHPVLTCPSAPRKAATIPILEHAHGTAAYLIDPAHYINPLPHVLMLTAIVVSVSTFGVALALAIRVYQQYRTLEEDEILAQIREP